MAYDVSTSAAETVRRIVCFTIPLVLCFDAVSGARGQSALDGFDPNANGRVNVAVLQPDGKIIVGGNFTTVSPNGTVAVTRNRIARLNTDGTLDTVFNPGSNDEINAIALQSDGKILVGGRFTQIGGQPRNGLARLDSVTGGADGFNPATGGALVQTITTSEDGKILMGGQFSIMGGQFRNNIARIDLATGLADSFNPNADAAVRAIVRQADGKILVGGSFNSIGGQTRHRVARLDPAIGLADSFNPSANSDVLAIALQADGHILVGGDFNGANSIGGATRNRIARLNRNTGVADSFDPNATDTVLSIAVQADGRVLVGGRFQGVNSIGGQNRDYVARLDPAGGADSFDPRPNGPIHAITMRPDGKILLAGDFGLVAPNGRAIITRNNLVLLEKDGSAVRTLNLGITASDAGVSPDPDVQAFAMQADGKIVIGGSFGSILGLPRKNIARINADGSLDPTFSPEILSQVFVYALTIQPDGKILVGGQFATIGGLSRPYLARLDPVTGLPDSFNPSAGNTVDSIVIQPDGKILVGGYFQSIGGQTRGRIARLDPNTGLADSFDPQANGAVETIALQRDGKILVGGTFNTIGGQSRRVLARLDPVTGLADSFNPNPSPGYIQSILVLPDGKILVSGGFTTIGGQSRHQLARLDPITGLPDSFNPGSASEGPIATQADGKILAPEFGWFTSLQRYDPITSQADSFRLTISYCALCAGAVRAVAFLPDGKLLVGGPFDSVEQRRQLALFRATNDTPALQELQVSPTSVVWVRGGSSPQLTQVRFEYSTDNVNYVALGEGNPVGTNWELTGLNLPIGQNIYVRGRARFTIMGGGSAESVVEEVRNAYLTGESTPTPPPSPTAGPPTPTPTPTIAPTATPTPSLTPSVTPACGLSQDFENVTTLPGEGWVQINNSSVVGTTGWFQGNAAIFPAQSGPVSSFIAANFHNGGRPSGLGDVSQGFPPTPPTPSPTPGPTPLPSGISNWLLSPPLVLQNGSTMTFYTRTVDIPQFPDRLQVRMSTNGFSVNVGAGFNSVGDFTTLMLDLNSGQTTTGYPNAWTQFSVTVAGVPTPTNGRLALRYFVQNGGPNGANADYIGIDTVRFTSSVQCESSTPTPTPVATVSILGTVLYCSNPTPGPVSNVTLSLTGSGSNSTTTDASGNYLIQGVTTGGNYTVTPSKSPRPPGSANINTVDVVAVQRHFLAIAALTGCRLMAADVNGDSAVNTVDVIAVQRFFLGMSAGLANTGKYQFNPATRSYSNIMSDQNAQNYDTLVFGDVAAPFVE